MFNTVYRFVEPMYQPSVATVILIFAGLISLVFIIANILSIEYHLGYRLKALAKIIGWSAVIVFSVWNVVFYDWKIWEKPVYTEVTATLEPDSVYSSIYKDKLCGRYEIDDASGKHLDICNKEDVNLTSGQPVEQIVLYKMTYKDMQQIRLFPWTTEYVQK